MKANNLPSTSFPQHSTECNIKLDTTVSIHDVGNAELYYRFNWCIASAVTTAFAYDSKLQCDNAGQCNVNGLLLLYMHIARWKQLYGR